MPIQSESLDLRLNRHPELKAKIEDLLSVVENAEGNLTRADDAEQRVIEEMRQIGQTALQGWATREEQQQRAEFMEANPSAERSGQKPLYWYTRYGQIEVLEQRFIKFTEEGSQIFRPFKDSAAVNCRGYSLPLQRVITDFGADMPFGKIAEKLQEHHGISVPTSSAQKITESHAQKILESQSLETEIPVGAAIACLITEIDGSMIPIVETDKNAEKGGTDKIDGRKTRTLSWKEARLSSVWAPQQETPIFGSTIGIPDEAGAQLLDIAIKAGLGMETFVHTVGDGATWIAAQVKERFGEPGRYLLDFYHVCEYLAAASHICVPINPLSWMEEQKTRLKANLSDLVLEELKPYLEPDSIPDKQAPVRAVYRYLFNRPNQLDYKGTIAAGLPIGSGEIESAHRYVIQNRLKLSGCWWTIKNARAMLALRVLRANQLWVSYWNHCPNAA